MAKRNNNIFNRSERENKASVARSEAYAESVRRMFSQTVTDILETLKMYPDITDGEMFSFDAQSIRVQKEVERLLRRLSASVTLATEEDIKIEWGLANDSVDALIESVVGKKVLRDPNFKAWTNRNAQAMDAFISRKHGIMTLKDRIWQTTQQLREEMEVALTVSIGEGKSAAQMSREVKKYLNDPDLMFRRFRYKIGEDEDGNPVYGRKWKKLVKDDDGRKHWIDYDKDSYKVGRGMYKSATKNAMRVTRTETNMAYRQSDQARWRNLDFIIGYHIEPSHNHEPEDCEPDICEQLKGDYPKDFEWSGWHPQCYSDDSEVYTSRGWLYFKDVKDDDLIMSLNPETRNVEWVSVTDRQQYEHKGEMVRFFNRSLDMLVTPDHRMVYINKRDGKIITRGDATQFTKSKGAIYRSSEYDAEERETIEINGKTYLFDVFCEFMGYWLSDGSLNRTCGVNIAHQEGRESRPLIAECVERMGYRAGGNKSVITFYDTCFNKYLQQFEHAENKYIPEVIKNASKRQIKIFLTAFSKCDAHVRKPHPFVGSHGHLCVPTTEEIVYFTTSKRMADDLSECIVKIGMRPSFSVQPPKIAVKRDGEIVKSNFPCWRISQCKSATATVFDKEITHYEGMVYDLTLERNHIMYVRRNGKCFWGSNCKCVSTPILMDEDEFIKMQKARARGEEYKSSKQITDYPEGFKQWCRENEDKIKDARKRGKEPYFVRDNIKVVRDAIKGEE